MASNDNNDSRTKSGRVLLADGHLGVLGSVHGMLEQRFESVFMVADERSLIDAVAALHPDLVVVDLSLPSEGEANIVRRLLETRSGLRVLVLSVHDEPTVARQILTFGARGLVLKRQAATDLMPAIEAVMNGKTHNCRAVARHFSRVEAPDACTSQQFED